MNLKILMTLLFRFQQELPCFYSKSVRLQLFEVWLWTEMEKKVSSWISLYQHNPKCTMWSKQHWMNWAHGSVKKLGVKSPFGWTIWKVVKERHMCVVLFFSAHPLKSKYLYMIFFIQIHFAKIWAKRKKELFSRWINDKNVCIDTIKRSYI